MKYFLLSILFLSISGCSNNIQNLKQVKTCENTFVLSGLRDKILLFEHKEKDVEFELLREYSVKNPNQVFYDCKRNIVIAYQNPSYNDKLYEEGIVIYKVSNNLKELYKLNNGFNGIIGKYKNGFIYSSASVKNSTLDKKYGYIHLNNIFPQEYVNKSKNLELKQDYKDGKQWHSYTEDKYFDLDEKKVTNTYPFSTWPISEIINNELYVFADGFLKINLDTKYAINLWPIKDAEQKLPEKSVTLFVNGIHYVISSSKNWDVASSRKDAKAVKFKKGSIYQIKDKKLSFVTKLPYDDIVYANSPDKKFLYIFTKSRNVMKFDIAKNKIVANYKIDVDIDESYELSTVGFTDDNFIVTFQKDRYIDSYLFVINRDFSKQSKKYHLDMGSIDITSNKTVSTNHMRVNNL